MLNGESAKKEQEAPAPQEEERPQQSVSEDQLKTVWEAFAEQRKDQAAEYHLLKRPYTFWDNVITLSLTNPIEEPLLQSIRSPLTTFLREQLQNSSLRIEGVMEEVESKRIAYTNKEKFDHLSEKYPILLELKDRLGLDPDF